MAVESDSQLHIPYHFPLYLHRSVAQRVWTPSIAFPLAARSPPASLSDCNVTGGTETREGGRPHQDEQVWEVGEGPRVKRSWCFLWDIGQVC